MANPTKWKPEIRNLLYKELLTRFGPYYTWDKWKPVNKEDEYIKFCEDFAKIVEILSGIKTTKDAIMMQIAWATTPQLEIKEGYISSFITNIAAAYNTGFIRNKDLPKTILMDRLNMQKTEE